MTFKGWQAAALENLLENERMISFTVPMKINSEKKHSVRYDAIGIDPGITSVYVMRTSLPEKIPQTISVKVEMESN